MITDVHAKVFAKVTRNCPSCGGMKRTVMDLPSYVPLANIPIAGGMFAMVEKSIGCYAVVCESCGNVQQYAKAVIDDA